MLRVARRLRPKDIFSLSFTSKLYYQMIALVPEIRKHARLIYIHARSCLAASFPHLGEGIRVAIDHELMFKLSFSQGYED